MFIECESCGREFERRGSRGRVPRFCGQRCRKRASRAVKAPFANDKRVWVRASGGLSRLFASVGVVGVFGALKSPYIAPSSGDASVCRLS